MADTTCLQTKLRNMSGVEKVFGFIPPHGKRLAAGQEVSIDGDIWDQVKNPRSRAALKAALLRGDIAIVDTPDEHHYDATLDETKVLGVDNGSVTVDDPSTGAYSSSAGP